MATQIKTKRLKKKSASVSAKRERAAKEPGVCLVTGDPTSSTRTNFRPGMDARLKGMLLKVLRGEERLDSIPEAALAKMRENGDEGLVGFRLRGKKLEHIGNFKLAAPKEAKETPVKRKKSGKESSNGSVKSVRRKKAAAQLAVIGDAGEDE
jgi:hypothetical protein